MSDAKWELKESTEDTPFPYLLTVYKPENPSKVWEVACERFNTEIEAVARARALVALGHKIDVTLDIMYSVRMQEDENE